MMQKNIYSTTAKETGIVEEKVTNDRGSMTNRIMFTEVMVVEQQDMSGNNMDFHKSRDDITRLVSNDSMGVLETEQKTQDIRKEDLKRATMQERIRENSAQVVICNREELKMLALRERRNRESIAVVIKNQNTPEVDSEVSNREELKRRALEKRRMRESDRHNLAGASLMCGRHPQHRGNEKKANVDETRPKDNSVSQHVEMQRLKHSSARP